MQDGKAGLLTIGNLAKASGATPRAIRFYEGLGLISSHERSKGGYRLFKPRELDKLHLLTGLRKSGFPIKEISELFSVVGNALTAAEAAKAMNGSLSQAAAKVREAAELLGILADDLGRTADVLGKCRGCDKRFDELICGACPPFEGTPRESYPLAMRALWPIG